MAGVSFVIERNEWFNILNDAAIAAGKNTNAPVLESVHLAVTADGLITAEATDRFVLARRTHRLAQPLPLGGTADIMLRAVEIPGMARTFPKTKTPVYLSINIDDDKLTVSNDSATATYQGRPDAPIKTQPLFDLWLDDGKNASTLMFNPDILVRFAKVTHDKLTGMRLKLGKEGRPALVEIGDHFIGLIMPMRDEP